MEDNEHEDVTVAFAVIATAVAGQVIVRPAGAAPVRVIDPAKLKVLVRVIVEDIDVPVAPLGDVALIVKSPTWDTKLAV